MPTLPFTVLQDGACFRREILRLNECLAGSNFMLGQSMLASTKLSVTDFAMNARWIQALLEQGCAYVTQTGDERQSVRESCDADGLVGICDRTSCWQWLDAGTIGCQN